MGFFMLNQYRLSFLLAWRFLWSANREPAVASMVRVCFLGILIGSCALTLIACIMQGFETATRQQLQSIHPELMIRGGQDTINYEKISTVLKTEFPEISDFAPMLQRYALVKQEDSSDDEVIVQLTGIDPEAQARVSCLERMIVNPAGVITRQTFSQLLVGNQVVIGTKLAQALGLSIDDTFTLVYMTNRADGRVGQVPVRIVGLIKTGIDEFDTGLVLANYAFVHNLFPDQTVSQVGLKLATGMDEKTVLHKLRARIPLEIVAWHELYPALLVALRLEKYVMFFVITLICLVASMNIISLLFMLLTQKRSVIALLRACGCSMRIINITFVLIGIFIGISAALIGLALSVGIGLLLRNYPLIQLPDIYYTQYLPITLHPLIFLSVFCVVLAMSIFATLIPLKRIASINIADVLRFEG